MLFCDPFAVYHAQFDGIIGSLYGNPQPVTGGGQNDGFDVPVLFKVKKK